MPHGDEVLAVANRLTPRFQYVVATQDWHPRDHRSFASQHPGRKPGDIVQLAGLDQVLWPDHCVQESSGAEFHEGLEGSRVHAVFRKGTDRNLDSYSAFFDNARRRSTGLGEHLRQRGADEVYLLGLATEYCVKFSAMDAAALGLRTRVVREGCRGINLAPGDVQRAWEDMLEANIDVVSERTLR